MRLITSLASLLLLAASGIAAADTTYKLGVNYQAVLPAQPVSTNPGQVEVIDFFWYNCPHCNALEPYLEAWERSKPANVVLRRVPAILQPDWEPAARAYYTSEALGLLDKSHKATFDEIHQNHDVMQTEADFERFFVKQYGVDPKKFESIWNSPEVDAKVGQAAVLAVRYGLMAFGVPTVVVNGKWLTGGDFGV